MDMAMEDTTAGTPADTNAPMPAMGRQAAQSMSAQNEEAPDRMLSLEELESKARSFREQRREKGVSQADADWIARPFAAWLRGLEPEDAAKHRHAVLERETMAALAVGMAETLSIRDALIVSLVAGAEQCSERRMVDFAVHPHDPRNTRNMYRLLRSAFDDAQVPLDRQRCINGVRMMLSIAGAAPRRFGVQPYAVTAYILWWMGEQSASRYVRKALGLDSRCTLAAIVHSALEHDIGPANRGKKHRGREGEMEAKEKSWE
ncbi:MAG: DUF4192 domain-containing protein [Bifidobacterium sp.]|jgi:hypothetical protein|nr:DUF4192 domain-containing protein [Bifidobacterium sp.]